MGQEITKNTFDQQDFEEFRRRVAEETRLLQSWVDSGVFQVEEPMAGCELEAWLVDSLGQPSPDNKKFLEKLNSELVVPELSTFNIELNTEPQALDARTLDTIQKQLSATWADCELAARKINRYILMIGIMPTVRQSDLCVANLSSMRRYKALNEQIFRLRKKRPVKIDIQHGEHLSMMHDDVMLEAATTSFQIHYKVDVSKVVRAFNASKILSAPMVAVSGNSPYLFGYDLWDETRIPLFEQSISVGGSDYSKRVTFGIRYARDSIMECFEANRDRYPVLLPELLDTPPEKLAHLQLHNGTIWRWNRPLVGFSKNGAPHFRIEHRVIPAGPTLIDMIANMAFYFGALTALVELTDAPEQKLPFEKASANFYEAARQGLNARAEWFDGDEGIMRDLLLNMLLPLAEQGLLMLGYEQVQIEYWLSIVRERIQTGQTGSCWQRKWIASHGRNFGELVQAYHQHQTEGRPVHCWPV